MNEFGFPAGSRCRFVVDNRRYRVNADGAEVLSILAEIYEASLSREDSCWALRLRDAVRRVELLNVRSVLVHVIEKTPNERMRLLAIWLRGRCGGYIGTSTIAKFAGSACFQTQKESVRTLRRMSGWSHLREIANSAESSRIRNMATQEAGKPLHDRLSRMLRNVQPISVSSRRVRFWLQPGLQIKRTAPKTIETIRNALESMKRLVSNSKD